VVSRISPIREKHPTPRMTYPIHGAGRILCEHPLPGLPRHFIVMRWSASEAFVGHPVSRRTVSLDTRSQIGWRRAPRPAHPPTGVASITTGTANRLSSRRLAQLLAAIASARRSVQGGRR